MSVDLELFNRNKPQKCFSETAKSTLEGRESEVVIFWFEICNGLSLYLYVELTFSEESSLKSKPQPKINFVFSLLVSIGLISFATRSQALDIILSPSPVNSLVESALYSLFGYDSSVIKTKTKEEIWQEYLTTSATHARRFQDAALAKNVSLKAFMCATNTSSQNVVRIKKFQNEVPSDFGLEEGTDQIAIAKLYQLQLDYAELCQATSSGTTAVLLTAPELVELNERVSLVIAETVFFSIYNTK
jgi:hypothetical protein